MGRKRKKKKALSASLQMNEAAGTIDVRGLVA